MADRDLCIKNAFEMITGPTDIIEMLTRLHDTVEDGAITDSDFRALVCAARDWILQHANENDESPSLIADEWNSEIDGAISLGYTRYNSPIFYAGLYRPEDYPLTISDIAQECEHEIFLLGAEAEYNHDDKLALARLYAKASAYEEILKKIKGAKQS